MIRFHRHARTELNAAKSWYRFQSADAAFRLACDIDLALESVVSSPEACDLVDDDFRRIHLRKFPYHIIFKVTRPGDFLVLAVAHDRRRPDYWRRRVRA
ncbi:Plasmid stabilization system protein [Caulifigura coniformis]|uniref:Plasmid stabilization system protein n=1 Tax=Caulifigura coniformis TaxID=2527983 RepID=A0A517SN11_9PLAN|nr:type II toxin-antitoxin system RelE/ParE family toxin [Caulifigura coniformis]QDT57517.1 Plasmid stabilization system protein [Caulifigura coniformis]